MASELFNEDEITDVVIIENREQKIERMIKDLMSGEMGLSFSKLKAFRENPTEFVDYVLKEKKQTEAMYLGTVVHCLVWEPKEFDHRYVIMDDTDICLEIGGAKPRSTNKYKEWKADFYAAVGPDMKVVPYLVWKNARFMANCVLNNRAARKVIALCTEFEKKIQWEYNNFKFTGYYDGGGERVRADLKIMRSAQAKQAQRTIIDMWYYGQASMYLTAEGIMLPFYIICVDRKGGVSVHKLHKHLIEHGLKEYETIVQAFNDCLLKERFDESYDFWAEWGDGIYNADKPAYLY